MKIGTLNLHNTELELTAGNPAQLFKGGLPQIAFSGRSNVGKSSLVNSLIGRKRLARVSSEPGKTITVNYYKVDGKLYLVDLPGYGYARRSRDEIKRWSELTQFYFENNTALKKVLQLVDIKAGFSEDDYIMLDWMNGFGIPYMLVATKCDRFNKTELNKYTTAIISDKILRPGTGMVLNSSKTGDGRNALWEKITESV